MKKWTTLLVVVLLATPFLQSSQDHSVDLHITWETPATFEGPQYTYRVKLVDWDKCDSVYWDGSRCVFTAGIQIAQIDNDTIRWEKEYLHLKYGDTEINKKFKDIILKKVKINKIAFNDGYVSLTIFYENRYDHDERPLYEKIIKDDDVIIYMGDSQNLYSFHLSAYNNDLFYVFYVNGEKQSKEGANLPSGERVELWHDITIEMETINNNSIFRIYAPTRFRILTKERFSIQEKDIVTVNGKDVSINDDVISVEDHTHLLKENTIIVTSIGWLVYQGGTMTVYAEDIDITTHDPQVELEYNPLSVMVDEQKSYTLTVTNTGRGLAEVDVSISGMDTNVQWTGTLEYHESKEMEVELSPKTEHDTLKVTLNDETTTLPITVETPVPTTKTPTTRPPAQHTTSSPRTEAHEDQPRKKPLTVFFVMISLTFLTILGQNWSESGKKKNTKKEVTKKPEEESNEGKDTQRNRGLPTKPFNYFNKRI